MMILTIVLSATVFILAFSLVLAVVLALHYKNDRDAWRRSAWRAAQSLRNQETDINKAHQVAVDLANRGFK
jgi:hypothetical protein